MRNKLRDLGCKERYLFTARFARFGFKNGWTGPVKTLLLTDVTHNGVVVCDHLWFTCGKQFESLDLKEGDTLSFSARVSSYTKGYKGWREDVFDRPITKDWRLSFPTKVKKETLNGK